MIYRAVDSSEKTLGLVITKVEDIEDDKQLGLIADIIIPSRKRDILFKMLYKAEIDFKSMGVYKVDAWATIHSFYFRSLLYFGFVPVQRFPFIVPANQAKIIQKNGWAKSKRWVINMADSDNI